jgi:hypothetical protein
VKRLNPDILIGLLIASLFWVGVFVWQSSQPPNHTGAASQTCEGTKNECAKVTTDERIADYTWWLAVLTAGLVCSGLIQFGFLIRSDNTARVAAAAAQLSAEIARQTLQVTQRAEIVVLPGQVTNFDKEGEDIKISVTINNIGQTPARSVEYAIFMLIDVYPPPPEKIIIGPKTRKFATLQRNVPHTVTTNYSTLFTSENKALVETGAMRAYLFGAASYKDDFGLPHSLEFLFAYDGATIKSGSPEILEAYNNSN